MFGKIKDKLKNVFKRTEEVLEDKPTDVEEVKEIQDEMLKDVPEIEKKAIKEHKELPVEEVKKNKIRIEKQEEKEQELEKEVLEEIDSKKKEGFFSRAFSGIKKKKITDDVFEEIWVELELFLLEINIAYDIVSKIGDQLRVKLVDNSFSRFNLLTEIRSVMVSEVSKILKERESSLLDEITLLKSNSQGPIKILVLGVNGTGKTTSIAKICKYLKNNGLSVVVAAADTFRAAAIEQLESHCKNVDTKVIKHRKGSDPGAVAYDAVEHAKAKNIDVVLIDTAGRMPNNRNLMMELEKVKRVSAADLAVFVGDSVSGNDLIDQISLFDKIVTISGSVLTKVDTDERPGSIVTIAYTIEKPIYFLGTGQGYGDLVEFLADEIATKLFEIKDE